MINIALFIASEKGYFGLKNAIQNGLANKIKFVATFKETNVTKSYDEDIEELCRQNKINHYKWAEVKNNLLHIMEKLHIDIAFTISWKFLIDTNINKILKFGLVVFHDSLLPKYRGFAPTPTAIMCGEKKIGISALLAVDGVDEGDIILQKEIEVDDDDYIADIINKEAHICADMITEIIKAAETGSLVYKKQDHSQATYSIWRNPEDCKIDWSNSAVDIRNMIRAVSDPYPGAYFFYNGRKVIVDKAELTEDMNFAIRQHGKIWQIISNCPIVICGKGMIKITRAHYEDGSPVTFNKLRINLNMEVV